MTLRGYSAQVSGATRFARGSRFLDCLAVARSTHFVRRAERKDFKRLYFNWQTIALRGTQNFDFKKQKNTYLEQNSD